MRRESGDEQQGKWPEDRTKPHPHSDRPSAMPSDPSAQIAAHDREHDHDGGPHHEPPPLLLWTTLSGILRSISWNSASVLRHDPGFRAVTTAERRGPSSLAACGLLW